MRATLSVRAHTPETRRKSRSWPGADAHSNEHGSSLPPMAWPEKHSRLTCKGFVGKTFGQWDEIGLRAIRFPRSPSNERESGRQDQPSKVWIIDPSRLGFARLPGGRFVSNHIHYVRLALHARARDRLREARRFAKPANGTKSLPATGSISARPIPAGSTACRWVSAARARWVSTTRSWWLSTACTGWLSAARAWWVSTARAWWVSTACTGGNATCTGSGWLSISDVAGFARARWNNGPATRWFDRRQFGAAYRSECRRSRRWSAHDLCATTSARNAA